MVPWAVAIDHTIAETISMRDGDDEDRSEERTDDGAHQVSDAETVEVRGRRPSRNRGSQVFKRSKSVLAKCRQDRRRRAGVEVDAWTDGQVWWCCPTGRRIRGVGVRRPRGDVPAPDFAVYLAVTLRLVLGLMRWCGGELRLPDSTRRPRRRRCRA